MFECSVEAVSAANQHMSPVPVKGTKLSAETTIALHLSCSLYRHCSHCSQANIASLSRHPVPSRIADSAWNHALDDCLSRHSNRCAILQGFMHERRYLEDHR